MSVPNFHALASSAPSSLPGPAVTFADLKRAVLNHLFLGGMVALAGLLLATVYVFNKSDIFAATCTLQVNRGSSTEVKLDKDRGPSDESLTNTLDFLKTQERVLSSRVMAERVIKRLSLEGNPDFDPSLQSKSFYESAFAQIRSLILVSPKELGSLEGEADDPLNSQVDPRMDGLIRKYYENVSVRLFRNSMIFEITATTVSPRLSARIANAHADEFIKYSLEQRFAVASTGAEFLQKEADKVKARLAGSEEKLQKYREETSLSTTPDSEQKVLEDLRTQLAKSRSELAQFEERYLEKHPKLIAARSTTAKLEKETKEREDALMDLRSKTVGYDALNRQIEADRILFKNVLEKLKELNVQSTVATTNINVVDQAKIPRKKVGPARVKSMMFGLAGGIVAGIVLCLILELGNQTLRTPEDIAATLASPFLGYIPHCKSQSAGLKLLAKDQEVDRALMESYRTIQAVLRYQPESSDARVILITSACPDEGKTYNAVHFARSYAEIGFRTLLIEADLRRPSIPRITGLSETPNLIAACSPDAAGEPDLMAISQKTSVPKLRVIVAGGSTLASPEILAGNRFREILALARKTFDRIVIDTPPLGALGDSLGLSTMVDGVIWVTRFGKVKKRIVKTAFERLSQIKAKVLGVVLNDLDRRRLGSAYYYDYNRYGGDYYNTERKSSKPRTSNHQPPTTHSQPPTTQTQPPPNNQQAKVTILKPPAA